jgi:hypothetical protein
MFLREVKFSLEELQVTALSIRECLLQLSRELDISLYLHIFRNNNIVSFKGSFHGSDSFFGKNKKINVEDYNPNIYYRNILINALVQSPASNCPGH